MDAHKTLTLEEFLALPESVRGERAQYIGGQIVQKALPGGRHGNAEIAIALTIGQHFRRKKKDDGTGGWWIMTETSVVYPNTREVPSHDIVGWRRERVPECPLDYPVRDRPDWVCEIAVSTLRKDTRDLKRTLEIEDVPFYWVLDAANERLIVFERIDGKLVQTRELFREDGVQRIPPFDAVEIQMGVLLGDDPE
jgi:Uma2 family endonuclease